MGALLFTLSINAQDISVSVQNSIKIGDLAGNRKLEFGVKNILEEALMDKGFLIMPSSKNSIFAELIYMDVLKTQSNLSIFHKDENSVVIRIKAKVLYNGENRKPFVVEESASEVSTSTLVIGVDGKFNQQNLSTALKKACLAIVEKL